LSRKVKGIRKSRRLFPDNRFPGGPAGLIIPLAGGCRRGGILLFCDQGSGTEYSGLEKP